MSHHGTLQISLLSAKSTAIHESTSFTSFHLWCLFPCQISLQGTILLGHLSLQRQALRQLLRLPAAQLCQATLVGVQIVLPMTHQNPGVKLCQTSIFLTVSCVYFFMIFPHLESWSCKHPTLHPQEPLSTCELCTTSPHPAEESPKIAKQHPPQHQVKIQMSNGSWCLHLLPNRWTTTIPICVPCALPKTTGIRALGRICPPCFLAFLGYKGVLDTKVSKVSIVFLLGGGFLIRRNGVRM